MAGRKSFLLRIDPALWTELETWAQAELRSVNGQIEFLLRQAVQLRKRTTGAKTEVSPAAGAIEEQEELETGETTAGLDSSETDISLL